RVLIPLDDVDFLTLQLADNCLHALPAHADAGADRIDRRIPGNDRDLRARARIAGHRLDLHDAVVDFRHLLREQLRHRLPARPRQKDLRAALLASHVVDIGADAVAEAHVLARYHLIAADDAFGATEIDDDIAVLDAFHRTVADLPDAILVFVELPLA